MKKTITKIIKTIKKHKSFLILAHDNPDGDSAGSGLALKSLLNSLGKKCHFVLGNPIPERYSFLPQSNTIKTRMPKSYNPEVVFVIDTAGWGQIGHIDPQQFKNKIIINIDHHIDNKRFGTINWIDTKAAAVGEQIYAIFKNARIPLTKATASHLYTAIITDTGSFRYSNTTTNTHKITSDLLASGIEPSKLTGYLYENIPLCKQKLMSLALNTLKTKSNGKIIWMWVTKKMFTQAGAKHEHTEAFIDSLKSVSGVKVAIIFKEEINDGERRVTFRSKDSRIAVNEIAHQFNGGGHPAAAGCTIKGSNKEVERKVLKTVTKMVNRFS